MALRAFSSRKPPPPLKETLDDSSFDLLFDVEQSIRKHNSVEKKEAKNVTRCPTGDFAVHDNVMEMIPEENLPSPHRSPVRRAKLRQQLLDVVLRRVIPAAPAAPAAPKEATADAAEAVNQEAAQAAVSGASDSSSKKESSSECDELLAFRKFLTKSHGNVTRAFRVMKSASLEEVGQGLGSHMARRKNANQLTSAEFEWCVTSLLKYGDRQLAKRLFRSLDREGAGAISLFDLAQSKPTGRQSLTSLIEFRRLLLDSYPSLSAAFRELEEYLSVKHPGRSVKDRSMSLAEFVDASGFFGMDVHQATHVFGVLDQDGNGDLTLQEFLSSLSNMPRNVLLQDFRQRLLARYPSILCAFRELAGTDGEDVRMKSLDFISALSRIGVADMEGAELFRLIDADRSGDVCLKELRNAAREGSPETDAKGFWQRFASEWPSFNTASARRGSGLVHARDQLGHLVNELTAKKTPHPARCINFLAFDAIAARLDVSKENAAKLFRQLSLSTRRQPQSPIKSRMRSTANDMLPGMVCADLEGSTSIPPSPVRSPRSPQRSGTLVYLDDFLDQLHVWAGEPSGKSTSSSGGIFDGVMRPLKAAISSFKADLNADLQIFGPSSLHESSVGSNAAGSMVFKEKTKKHSASVKLPWSTRFAPLQPVAFNPVVLTEVRLWGGAHD